MSRSIQAYRCNRDTDKQPIPRCCSLSLDMKWSGKIGVESSALPSVRRGGRGDPGREVKSAARHLIIEGNNNHTRGEKMRARGEEIWAKEDY